MVRDPASHIHNAQSHVSLYIMLFMLPVVLVRSGEKEVLNAIVELAEISLEILGKAWAVC